MFTFKILKKRVTMEFVVYIDSLRQVPINLEDTPHINSEIEIKTGDMYYLYKVERVVFREDHNTTLHIVIVK